MQGESRQFRLMMMIARSNHLYAEFLLGWMSLPASEARCQQAVEILQAAVQVGDPVEAALLRALAEAHERMEE